MPVPTWSIRRVREIDAALIDSLAEILIDCVAGGASVSFMHPLSRARARSFWQSVAAAVSKGHCALLIAEDAQGVCGTVQLIFELPENQPHRADLAKMLVHRRTRRQGFGAALLKEAESTARAEGKLLIVLDAVTGGDAERMYARHGWIKAGVIPNYALMPDGTPCSTTYMYRKLG